MATTAKARTPARRPGRRRVPIGELRDKEVAYHRERKSAPNTITTVRAVFRGLIDDLGLQWCHELEDPDVIRRFEGLRPHVRLNSRRNHLSSLRGAIRRGLKWGLLRSEPPFPRYVSTDPATWPGRTTRQSARPEDIARYLGHLEAGHRKGGDGILGAWEYLRLHALVATLVRAGIGLWQAMRLRVADVDLSSTRIWISGSRRRPRPGSPPTPIRIDPELAGILAEWIPLVGCEWLFPGVRLVSPWYVWQARQHLRATWRDAGLGGTITFESLLVYHAENAVSSPPSSPAPATRQKSATSAATRQKSATSAAAAKPAIELGRGRRARLRGEDMGVLEPGEYRALKILLKRYPDGYDLKEMSLAYGGGRPNSGWRKALRSLRGRDPRWKTGFGFPRESFRGKTPGRVRILPW